MFASKPGHIYSSKTRPKEKRSFLQAEEMQQLVHKDATSQECTPKERCMLVSAFKDLELLKLRLKMKPAPKPVDVAEMKAKEAKARASQKLASGFSETDGNGATGA